MHQELCSKELLTDDPLWQKIQNYQFDTTGADLPFSSRLARENGWNRNLALRAINEYRRFVFLACRAGHSVTPSDEVDQVWHLHLQYSREYWENFCPFVLGQKLHHDPTLGGTTENAKYDKWYNQTLLTYRRFFQIDPPVDLWPPSDRRFGEAPFFRRINTRRLWTITKFRGSKIIAGLAIALVSVAAIASSTETQQHKGISPWIFLAVFGVIVGLIYFDDDVEDKDDKNSKGGGCGGGGSGGDGSGCGAGCGGGCGGCGDSTIV